MNVERCCMAETQIYPRSCTFETSGCQWCEKNLCHYQLPKVFSLHQSLSCPYNCNNSFTCAVLHYFGVLCPLAGSFCGISLSWKELRLIWRRWELLAPPSWAFCRELLAGAVIAAAADRLCPWAHPRVLGLSRAWHPLLPAAWASQGFSEPLWALGSLQVLPSAPKHGLHFPFLSLSCVCGTGFPLLPLSCCSALSLQSSQLLFPPIFVCSDPVLGLLNVCSVGWVSFLLQGPFKKAVGAQSWAPCSQKSWLCLASADGVLFKHTTDLMFFPLGVWLPVIKGDSLLKQSFVVI